MSILRNVHVTLSILGVKGHIMQPFIVYGYISSEVTPDLRSSRIGFTPRTQSDQLPLKPEWTLTSLCYGALFYEFSPPANGRWRHGEG